MRRLYAVWATDAPDMLARREKVREAHRQRLREPGAVRVVLAGATSGGPGGSMNGSLLIVEAESQEAVATFVAADPYVAAGVYASVDIRPWTCGLGSLQSPE